MFHHRHYAQTRVGGVSSDCLGHFWRASVGKSWRAPKRYGQLDENQPSRALGRGVRDQHDRLAIRTWSSFCRSAVIQTQSDQIGDIRFAHTHDRVCAAPIDLHGSIGLRNGATGEHDVVDISRDFSGIFRLQNPRVAHSDDLRWVQ